MNSVLRQLRGWQLLETVFQGTRLLALFVVVVTVALGLSCLTDWLYDRYADTPMALRTTVLAAQVVLAAVTAFALLWFWRRPTIDHLAGRAEAAIPELGHRLVTAIQLNREGARTAGMSAELIAQVTDEAGQIASRHQLSRLADSRPLKVAAVILLPILVLLGILFAVNAKLMVILLQRQLLQDVEIPRSVKIENKSESLYPSGDAIELVFHVTGPVDETTVGRVRVVPDGQPSEYYDIVYSGKLDDSTHLFQAKLPPASQPFRFTARIRDGRMKKPAEVRFEPRPVVQSLLAYTVLPSYVDPEGNRRYERLQQQGEVIAPADASIRVRIEVTKPIERAMLTVFGRDDTGAETPLLRKAMALTQDKTQAELLVDLPPRPTGYSIEVMDAYKFTNLNPPRRGITITPDEPPVVELLSEVLTDNPGAANVLDLEEVNGMPLVLGGRVQIGYRASSPLGLSRAYIIYRVNEGPWSPLPLARVVADEQKVGRFIPEMGVFERYTQDQQVDFYWLPAVDPENEPAGLVAGGRVNFLENALKKMDRQGRPTKLELGDRVEFYVAVYDRKPGTRQDPVDRNAPGRPPGTSESRIKTVVSQSQLEDWARQRDQSRERLRRIEEAQRGVFGQPGAMTP